MTARYSLRKELSVSTLPRGLVVFCLVSFASLVTGSAAVALFAAIVALVVMVNCEDADNFCFSLFLIPNIRLLDVSGISFLVNALILSPLFIFIFRKRKVNKFALVFTFGLLAYELLHELIFSQYSDLVANAASVLTLLYAWSFSTDRDVGVDPYRAAEYLALGIIASSVLYLLSNPMYARHLIDDIVSGERFEAFADDPNYFACYICVALAVILCSRLSNTRIIPLALAMIGIGFLTNSKMELSVSFTLVIIWAINVIAKFDSKQRRTALILSGCLLFFSFLFSGTLFELLNRLIVRAGLNSGQLNMAKLSTGRSTILGDYVSLFTNDPVALIYGYGLDYYPALLQVGATVDHYAHNTYFDVVASWGVVGLVVVCAALVQWFSELSATWKSPSREAVRKLPAIVLAVCIFSLSCLSSSMFWLLVAVVSMVIWKEPVEHEVLDNRPGL